jgi:hypothetical protein
MRSCKFFTALIVIGAIITSGVFAQEKYDGSIKNGISISMSYLGGGGQYERMITPKFSVGAEFFTNVFGGMINTFGSTMGLEGFGRAYIWHGISFELGLGFGIQNGGIFIGRKIDDLRYSVIGSLINPGFAWKFDVGKVGGFFIEPKITVPITIGRASPIDMVRNASAYDTRAMVGLKATIAFGGSF